MHNLLLTIQILLSVLLSGMILVQSRGAGIGRAWGTTKSFTRRGLEKLLFKATFVLSALFIIISIIQLVV